MLSPLVAHRCFQKLTLYTTPHIHPRYRLSYLIAFSTRSVAAVKGFIGMLCDQAPGLNKGWEAPKILLS